jgi:spore coat protein CotH
MRRLRYRIPVRLRHYWKLVAFSVVLILAMMTVFGSGMIRPYSSSADAAAAEVVIENIEGEVDLFDSMVAHSIKISFNQDNYEAMLSEYFDSGEKDYIPADVTIDGVTIKDVGIRLKGNSTLSSLTWNGQRRQGGGPGGGGQGQAPGGGQPPEGMDLPEGMAPPDGGQIPEGMEPPDGGEGGFRGGGMATELKGEEPESLPWLIKFDEYVEGRRYQGRSQLSVRPGTTENKTQLSEAVAVAMVDRAGEPSQQFTYSGFAVNGRESGPRLVIDYLDTGYAEELGNGVLYKSLATSQFSYQGDDQTEYTDDFKQINKLGSHDLQPVIQFLQWLDQADDEEFAANLSSYVDVDSFARYVALQNLLLNFDDMSGPGKNFYLWYDLDTKKISVISWDLNFAFGGSPETGPNDELSMGGMARPGQEEGRQGQPEQRRPPEGQQQDQNGGRAGRMMGNDLKDRFLKAEAFAATYQNAYWALHDQLYGNGDAVNLATEIADRYRLNAGADTAAIDADLAALSKTLSSRAAALAKLDRSAE